MAFSGLVRVSLAEQTSTHKHVLYGIIASAGQYGSVIKWYMPPPPPKKKKKTESPSPKSRPAKKVKKYIGNIKDFLKIVCRPIL